MLDLKSIESPQLEDATVLESLTVSNIEQRLAALQRSDRSLYNLIGMEVWSIAKTMDELYPGFWSQFMANRQVALKQFIQQKQTHPAENSNL